MVEKLIKLVVPTALFRYQQIESRRLATNFVEALAKAQPSLTLQALCQQLCSSLEKFAPGKST